MGRMLSLNVKVEDGEPYFAAFDELGATLRSMGAKYAYASVTATDDVVIEADISHDGKTLDKVRGALIKALGSNAERAVDDIATDCITEMQNVGILFRERPQTKEHNDGPSDAKPIPS
jgi:hypothetical protein